MTGAWAVFRRMGLRHVRQRPLRTTLTAAGVVVGVALVFATTLLNRSVDEGVGVAVRQVAGSAALEVAAATSAGMEARLAGAIAAVEGVDIAAPVLRQLSVAEGPAAHTQVLALGVTPALAALGPVDGPEVHLDGHLAAGGLVLSSRVASTVGATVGDEIRLRGADAGVTVSGVLSGGTLELVNRGDVVVLPLADAQAAFARPDTVDAVYVSLSPGADIEAAARAIEGVVDGAAVVSTPEQRVATLTQSYAAVGALTSLAGMVALVVGLLVVHNTLAMAVTDRRREYAVALSLGTRHRDLAVALLAEGVLLGAAGAAGGIGLGWLLAHALLPGTAEVASEIIPIAAAPVLVVGPAEVATAVLLGVGACVLGAATAARRIGAVKPNEALRAGSVRQPYVPSPRAVGRAAVCGVGLAASALAVGVIAVSGQLDAWWFVHVCVAGWLIGIGLLLPWVTPRVVGSLRPALARLFGAVGRLAGDGLAYNPTRVSVGVAALALTLGMVLAVAGALRSYETVLRSTVEEAYTAPLYVVDDIAAPGARLTIDAGEQIGHLDGVAFASTIRYVDLVVGGQSVMGIVEPVGERVHSARGPYAALNPYWRVDYADAVAGGDILISRLLAQRLGLDAGDTVALPTPTGTIEVSVGGVVRNWGPVPTLTLDRGLYLRHWQDRSTDEIRIHVTPDADLTVLQRQVESLVATAGLAAQVHTVEEVVDDFVASLAGLLAVADAVLVVALLVAGLTVANTAFAAVLDRRWQLGMVQAIGATRVEVGRSLLLEAAVIGVIGVAGALIVGSLTGIALTAASQDALALSVPFRPAPSFVVLTAAAGVAVAALATLAPRRLASRQPLIESLRFE